ncbi:MAG: hypothetical protein AAF532_02170 [Planctomycetota bacterium]
MSPRLFNEWMAYDRIEGLPDDRDDTRAAVIGAAQLQAAGVDGVRPVDLLTFNDRHREAAEAEEARPTTRAEAAAEMFNAQLAFGALPEWPRSATSSSSSVPTRAASNAG